MVLLRIIISAGLEDILYREYLKVLEKVFIRYKVDYIVVYMFRPQQQ